MREALFVKQHSEKWRSYEQMHAASPDELAQRFTDITSDLSYARTFYPKSKTTVYLNGLAATLHQAIYRRKRERANRFLHFWKTELPLLFYIRRRQLGYAFIIFMAAACIGVLSAKFDDTFVRLIMGDDYVNMTNENISKGDPFGVYKRESSFSMFVRIAANNVQVSFVVFVLGLFAGLGTISGLLHNGVMLGAFEYYFFSKGLGMQSVLVIWIHGTLEIAAIIIAGGAGLVLGNGILFPGTYTRLQSFRRAAAEGTKIIVGLVPVFLTAAFFEGYVTRHTEMPVWLSAGILAGSLAFIIWYVVIYPLRLHRIHNLNKHGFQGRI
ncbi:stage II sporulation protein M [Pedobacter sp. JY14-1]|uniref:stage II sporulation protein M n=1 Tax=Pedobacter sp. JY14-1 TaxID=3034151 RepID=UPI0023E152B2|nr:stage II sporulation protein M [Pedobacter sp. JY14-1]